MKTDRRWRIFHHYTSKTGYFIFFFSRLFVYFYLTIKAEQKFLSSSNADSYLKAKQKRNGENKKKSAQFQSNN
jgi:hypothetical protein